VFAPHPLRLDLIEFANLLCPKMSLSLLGSNNANRTSAVHFSSIANKPSSIAFNRLTHNVGSDIDRITAVASNQYYNNNITIYTLNTESSEQQRLSKALASIPTASSVSQLVWLNSSIFLSSNYNGSASIYQYSHNSSNNSTAKSQLSLRGSIDISNNFPNLAATSIDLSTFTSQAAVATELGSVSLFDINSCKMVSTLPQASSGAISRVKISNNLLYISGNNSRVNLYDLRASDNHKPIQQFYSGRAGTAITAFNFHPTRPNLMCVGLENGVLSIFDTRESDISANDSTICSLQAHSAAISECSFLGHNPGVVLSASEDGSFVQFDFNKNRLDANSVNYRGDAESAKNIKPSIIYNHSQNNTDTSGRQAITNNVLSSSVDGIVGFDVDRASHTVAFACRNQRLGYFQYLN
jgi:hypothetical protein